MNVVFLLLLAFQNGASSDTQQREAQLRQVASVSTRQASSESEENSKAYATAREAEFVRKFNNLITTLMEFSDSYKTGQAMDIKKAQAIRKAWVELDKTMP